MWVAVPVVGMSESNLSDADKAYRAQQLVRDIQSDTALPLQERADDILDDLAVELADKD